MTKLIKKSCLLMTLLPLALLATEVPTPTKTKDLAIYYTSPTEMVNKYNKLLDETLPKVGFTCLDPRKRINDKYKKKWGSTQLDVLSFMPIVNNNAILPLLNLDPRIAGFLPFNLLMYKKLDEKVTHIGHLVPEAMLDILGIENDEVRRKFSDHFKVLDATIEKELSIQGETIPYKKLPEKSMINFEYTFDTPKDMEDFIDEFQMNFEMAFSDKGYMIAGYRNFMKADNAKTILSSYDGFWSYSLCHLEFSYKTFDTIGARPDIGLFAPCSMFMYIKKGSNTLVGGMPRLQNWSDLIEIQDEARVKRIKKYDTEMEEILKAFGMKLIANKNPLL